MAEDDGIAPMKPCKHPEESVECFFDSHPEATEHAEWCSLCGAYRVNSGYGDTPWILPKTLTPDTAADPARADRSSATPLPPRAPAA